MLFWIIIFLHAGCRFVLVNGFRGYEDRMCIDITASGALRARRQTTRLPSLESKTQKSKQSQRFDLVKESQIHNGIFECKPYQLHMPPIAQVPPKLHKDLTNPKTYEEITGETGASSDVMDGPVDVFEMVQKGSLPEFRHTSNQESTVPGEANLLTWNVHRPPEVFIIHWDGVVNFGVREHVVIAARVLKVLKSKKYPKHVQDIIDGVAERFQVPNWLSEWCRYARPYIDALSDWAVALDILFNQIGDLMTTVDLNVVTPLDGKNLDELNDYDKVHLLTHGGDPNRLVDFLGKFKHALKLKSNALYQWKRPSAPGKQDGLYHRHFASLGIDSVQELTSLYASTRLESRENVTNWDDLILYRTDTSRVPQELKWHHHAYNEAVIKAIKHHIEVFKVPVYITSELEDTSEVYHQLQAMNITNYDLIRAFGREHGTVAQVLKGIKSSLKIDARIPIHYYGHRLVHMIQANELGIVANLVDWGHSTHHEKLATLYNPGFCKYTRHTRQLVYAMAQPTLAPGREWNLGTRTIPPAYEAALFHRKWHRMHACVTPDNKITPVAT